MVKNNKYKNWTLPGGGVEKGETLEQAAIREAWEETGLKVELGRLLVVNETFRQQENNHVLFFTFLGEATEGEIVVQDLGGIIEAKWMDIEEADNEMPYYEGGIEKLVGTPVSYNFQGVQS